MITRFGLSLLVWLSCNFTVLGQVWTGEVNKDLKGLEQRAKAGDPAAMAEYAFHSMRCVGGVRYDQKLIFDYFSRSAAAGDEEGVVGLAHCLAFGVGTERELQECFDLIQEPYERGHPVALKIMGFLYLGEGGILERDEEKYFSLTEAAADKGCVAAVFNLGIEDIVGRFGERDLLKGMNRMRSLHERDVFPMATGYMLYYLRWNRIWDDDEEVYRSCYKLAHKYARMGEPDTLMQVGRCYYGSGEVEKAVAYFAQAATQGSRIAWLRLRDALVSKNIPLKMRMPSGQRQIFALRAYLAGNLASSVVGHSCWLYFSSPEKPESQAMYPRYERDFRNLVRGGATSSHYELGYLYMTADADINPELHREDWAAAHFILGRDASRHALGVLGTMMFESKDRTKEDLPKILACAEISRGRGSGVWGNKTENWKKLQPLLNPEIRKKTKALKANGYPSKEEIQAAQDLLTEAGHLPPSKDSSD